MILAFILIIAAFLRLFQLPDLPISLFGDEIDVGYQAWSLFQTGRDYSGNFLPAYIQSISEYRAPLLMYAVAPFVGLLGPSVFSVRLPIALLGILNIYLIYLLANLLFPNLKLKIYQLQLTIGSLAAAFLAITPWHIHYSRVAFESTLLLTLILAASCTFIKALKTPKYFYLSSLFFILTFYTYSTANLFTPLLVASLFFIYKPKLQLKKQKTLILLSIILLLPFVYHLFFGQAAGRFKLISIFNHQQLIDDIIIQRTFPWIKPGPVERLFHNKPLAYAATFFKQYLEAFSPQFLFLNGDPHFRHSPSRFGELLWTSLPLLIIGFISLCLNLKKKNNQLLLFWLLISPIPSALTQGGGMQATRLIIILPPLIIITATGTTTLINRIKNKTTKLLFSLLLLGLTAFNLSAFWHRYTAHYRFESARIWHHGYQDIFKKLSQHQEKANKIYLNNTYEPSLLHFAFHTKFPPKIFQNLLKTQTLNNEISSDKFSGFAFGDKYYFGQLKAKVSLDSLLQPGDIYFAVQDKEAPGDWDWSKNPPENLKIIDSTRDVFDQPLFYLVTLK